MQPNLEENGLAIRGAVRFRGRSSLASKFKVGKVTTRIFVTTVVYMACCSTSALASPDVPLPSHLSPKAFLVKEITALTRKGISQERASRAISIQGRIAKTGLTERLQAAMGTNYAGVWFEPATSQLNVGQTSAVGRRTAEATIQEEGLSEYVVATPVRSTIAQLLAEQRRWNRKLAYMFARYGLKTGLEPQHNAVAIVLTSSVPVVDRMAMEREAAAASVNVRVSVVPGTSLSATPELETKCTFFSPPWENNTANCDPSIAAGVYIGSSEGGVCTAGPVAIPKAHKDRRVLLTAGHCLARGTNPFEVQWHALETAGSSLFIGEPEDFTFGGTQKGATYCAGLCTGGDYGDIPIAAGWRTGKANRPVYALTARWGRGTDKSYPVTGERAPIVGNSNCHEGRTSGESCGVITMLNVALAIAYNGHQVVLEGMVEDAGENLINESGDSGGPFLYVNGTGEIFMEGIDSSLILECVDVKANKKGEKYFKTQFECQSGSVFKEAPGNEGEWERKEYECSMIGMENTGAKYYPSKERCVHEEEAGKGDWERKPNERSIWEPLIQPVGGAVEGPFTKLKLELLTAANEKIAPRQQGKGGEPELKAGFTSKSGASTLEATGGTKISCSGGNGTGKATGTSEGTANLTLTGCEGFGVKCRTAGEAQGTIALTAKYLVVFVKETESEELGVVLKFNEATVECGTVCPKMTNETVHLRGSAVGLTTPVNKEITTGEVAKVVFSQSKGIQSPIEYVNGEGEKVSAKIELNGSGTKTFGFEQAGLADTDELTFEETVELEGDQ